MTQFPPKLSSQFSRQNFQIGARRKGGKKGGMQKRLLYIAKGVLSPNVRQSSNALLAQLVERTTLNRVVVGSIPTQGAFFLFET